MLINRRMYTEDIKAGIELGILRELELDKKDNRLLRSAITHQEEGDVLILEFKAFLSSRGITRQTPRKLELPECTHIERDYEVLGQFDTPGYINQIVRCVILETGDNKIVYQDEMGEAVEIACPMSAINEAVIGQSLANAKEVKPGERAVIQISKSRSNGKLWIGRAGRVEALQRT